MSIEPSSIEPSSTDSTDAELIGTAPISPAPTSTLSAGIGASDPDPTHELVTRSPLRLVPDPSRVIAKLFVPGEEVPETESRTAAVIARVLALDEAQVEATLTRTLSSFAPRHRDVRGVFAAHYETVAHRVNPEAAISTRRQLLIGAYFTHEYAIEGAALCNPSMVVHPDQSRLGPDRTRFVMSVRAVGEGHLSSIAFRTGVVGPGAQISIEPSARHTGLGQVRVPDYDLRLFEAVLSAHADDEVTAFLHRHLPARFTAPDLERALDALPARLALRQGTPRTVEQIRMIAASTYDLEFPAGTPISGHVLWPTAPTERHGMEDARFVRFTDDDGSVSYYATYTAFDGAAVTPQRLHTQDFRTFHVTQFAGPAAANKGMALFPRKIGGVYTALSRWDRENTSLASSRDNQVWNVAATVQRPRRPWELTQVGNCGSPVETAEGWLVLTHGVGPMRTYGIGVMLLDLADPSKIVADLDEPLITAGPDERDGYVPNVVYSCGAMRHGDTLVIPFGTSDTAISFATVDIPALIHRMKARSA